MDEQIGEEVPPSAWPDTRDGWRLVIAGVPRSVQVRHVPRLREGLADVAASVPGISNVHYTTEVRMAAPSLAGELLAEGWAVTEILPPGVLSSAEKVAAAQGKLQELLRDADGRLEPPTRAEFDALGATGGCIVFAAPGRGNRGWFPAHPSWWEATQRHNYDPGTRWWGYDGAGRLWGAEAPYRG